MRKEPDYDNDKRNISVVIFWFQFKTQYLQCNFPAASVVVFSLWYVVCGGSVVVIIQDDRPSIYLSFMTNAHIKMYS